MLWLLACAGLQAVLSSDIGYRPLGWLLLEQGQGVSLLNGAQLLLLRLLELGGVSDLGVGEIGGISVVDNPTPVSGEKEGRHQDCSRTVDHIKQGTQAP